ncbi:MAG: hypothetical protein ABI411_10235 [Tahibacter sp.]
MNHISVYQEGNGYWRWDLVLNGRAINNAKLTYASEALANQAALRATAVILAPAFDARGDLLRDPIAESLRKRCA